LSPQNESPENNSPEDEPSREFSQTALREVSTGGNIEIGQIVQKIVYLGLPLGQDQRRFLHFLLLTLCAVAWFAGLVRLLQADVDLWTWLLLLSGGGLLWLWGVYRLWFQQKGSALPSSDNASSRHTNDKGRLFALASVLVIPLVSGAGYFAWKSIPPSKVLILVAEFDGRNPQDYRLGENILTKLRLAAQHYPTIEVRSLPVTINEGQGSSVARDLGSQKKASIVIWGRYGVTSQVVQLAVHFEILRPLQIQLELGQQTEGQPRTFPVAELHSFKLQTNLSDEMAYLSLVTVGLAQYSKDDFSQAAKLFTDALAQVETAAQSKEAVFFYRGTALAKQGKFEEAVKDYDQAIKLKPDLAEAFNNRGTALIKQGKYVEAVKDYDQAIKLKPDYAEAFNNHGTALAKQGKYVAAVKDFDQAIELKPDDAEAFYNRGTAFFRHGKYEEAVKDYDQAIKLKPDFWEAMTYIGLIQYESGQVEEAKKHWKQAASLNSNAAEPRLALAVALYIQGDQVKGIALGKKALALDKRYADLEFLKKNGWGKRLLADAAKLLATL
jgi:tetratricopeptide (TPR) repeat protein